MGKSVLLIAIAMMAVGLEGRSTLHTNSVPLETNLQGLNRNQENEAATTNPLQGAVVELKENERPFVDIVSGAIIPDRKPLDLGKSTMAPVTVEAVLVGKYSNQEEEATASKRIREQMVAHKSTRTEAINQTKELPTETLLASKNIREQGLSQKSERIESNQEVPTEVTARKAIREQVVARKSTRTEQINDSNAALKGIREQGSAIKSPRTEQKLDVSPNDSETVSASKTIREQGTAIKSTRTSNDSDVVVVSASKGIRVEGGSAQKSTRVQPLKTNTNQILASKGNREQGIGQKSTRIEEINKTADDEHEFNIPPYGPFYCTAWCVASCVDKKFGQLPECETSCADFKDKIQCADVDVDCWTSCGGLMGRPSPKQLTAPKIVSSGYIQDPTFDPLSISITWDMISESSMYIVEFIPTPESSFAGAISLQDIVDHPGYLFKKADICHEYYARVAAVSSDGVGKMSTAVLIKSAQLQVPDFVMFTVLDTTITAGFTGKVALVRVGYSPLPGFGPNDYAINGRVSATQCKNPVNDLFMTDDDSVTYDGTVYYPLVHIEKSETNYEMVIIMPEEIFSADCLYSFKASSFITRCGLSTKDGLAEGVSGVDFRIDMNGLLPNDQSEIAQSSMQRDLSPSPICQMTGFDLKVLNNNNGKVDVVVTWDAILDNIHKTYLIHHWSNERSLLVSETSIPKPESQRDMAVFDTGDTQIVYHLPEPLNSDDLHEFKICAVSTTPEGDTQIENVPWETAPSIKVDMMSLNKNSLSLDQMNLLTKVDEKKITWLVLISLLGAVCFLLIASLLFGKNVKCGQTKRNAMTKIYSLPKNGSSVETKTKLSPLQDNSFSNPVPVV